MVSSTTIWYYIGLGAAALLLIAGIVLIVLGSISQGPAKAAQSSGIEADVFTPTNTMATSNPSQGIGLTNTTMSLIQDPVATVPTW